MPNPNSSRLSAAEIAGLLRLASAATIAVSTQAQDLQQRISRPLSAAVPFDLQERITRGVYNSVRAIAGLTDRVGKLIPAPRIENVRNAPGSLRENALSILNGVCGDHLLAVKNPLAITMQLRGQRSKGANYVVLVHGLCLNDSHWHGPANKRPEKTAEAAEGHVAALQALGFTPLYLRYNSGASIAENGMQFAALLAEICAEAKQVMVLAHSMGGLLTRLALSQLHAQRTRAIKTLRAVFYLGTPHAGAPLEQAGLWVEKMWARLPYAGALAPIAKLRSQGILDLRAGLHEPKPRRRSYMEFAIAASLRKAGQTSLRTRVADHSVGDGLVPIVSALALDAMATGRIPAERQCVLYQLGHLDLLRAPAVTAQLSAWIGAMKA